MGSLTHLLSRNSSKPLTPQPSAPTKAKPETQGHCKWAVIESDILGGEEILYVADPRYLAEAQQEEPSLVTYLLEEVAALADLKDDADALRRIHRIKKEFGGLVRRQPQEPRQAFKRFMDLSDAHRLKNE
ncbi:MAG: hypothetical protein HYT79_00050 [Elusimicrobia bacterium]|nr:hypothetical protein [Elusimicrobiota bacterium]